MSDLLKEKELLQAALLLWFQDRISHTDSAPPGSHLSLTTLTLNTTFPFLSSLARSPPSSLRRPLALSSSL